MRLPSSPLAVMKSGSRKRSRVARLAPCVRISRLECEAIRISSNENPLGPGKAAIDAILGKFPEANRYPFNSTPLDADLEILIARLNNGKRENVVLGVGSQELLKNAVRVFMSPTKHLVEPVADLRQLQPAWPERAAVRRSRRRRSIATTLRTDLAALLPHVKGAGLVYLCNPNNPTGDDQQRARRSATSSPRSARPRRRPRS